MPVNPPSARIGSSVANMKTMGKSSLGGKKSTVVHLNVVPMIDMFTILVIFLLMMFSATGEILYQQKDITMPKAYHQKPLYRLPIIAISRSVVVFEGNKVIDTPRLTEKEFPDLKIPVLAKTLKMAHEQYKREHPQPSPTDRDAFRKWMRDSTQIIIQADRGVPFESIKLVMLTAAYQGFSTINFAVVPYPKREKDKSKKS